jgi:DNA-binding NarL/FixJ family response regulator
MVGRGNPIKDIAEDLRLSDKTVRTHWSRILTKMGMRGNLEIVH